MSLESEIKGSGRVSFTLFKTDMGLVSVGVDDVEASLELEDGDGVGAEAGRRLFGRPKPASARKGN